MGRLEPVVGGKKKCYVCRESKPLSGFNKYSHGGKSGIASVCKKCMLAKRAAKLVDESLEEGGRPRRWPFVERFPCVRCFEMKAKEGGACGCKRDKGEAGVVASPAAG